MTNVLVIGGVAAGCMAAITAAKAGATVTLWEKNDRLGRKLAITGKGRCNVTNAAPINELIANITGNGRFMHSAFAAFDNQAVMDFFEGLGVPLKVERGQRVFPQSDKAADVISALERELKRLKVEVCFNTSARRLLLAETAESRQVVGAISSDGRKKQADAVILATGGATYRATGSSGDGYALAAAVGHRIIEPLPALVPLVAAEPWVGELAGLSLRNVEFSLYKNGMASKKNLLVKLFGELLFTHFGLSGPVVLTASRQAALFWRDNPEHQLLAQLNLKPALTQEQLNARLERELAAGPKRHLHNVLADWLPKSLILPFCQQAGLPADKPLNALQHKERQQLLQTIQALPISLIGTRPLNEGIVTCGGVCVKEVNPKTFASKLVAGLFIVGELLDVDALTGGYNLQIAFSSGHAAGMAAALPR